MSKRTHVKAHTGSDCQCELTECSVAAMNPPVLPHWFPGLLTTEKQLDLPQAQPYSPRCLAVPLTDSVCLSRPDDIAIAL